MNGEAGFGLAGSGAGPLEDEDPRRIGPIPLLGRLGSGGMGRVYLGFHEGRYAAVKQLLPSIVAEDQDFLRRFGHELDNLARLPEKATAPLLAGDRAARPPWFATAYVPGLTLTEALHAHDGPLPAEALWLLLREAAAGLAAVHALDMVHRDLKPSNVMLTLDGLTLIDFGVARAAEQSQVTRTGMVVGTPAYMSPEQASGVRRSTGAVDVFALGSVLAYAASGRPPFGDESGHAVLYRIVHEEPDLDALRDLDPDLADVVAACLDKDFEGRPTAAELVELAERHGPFTPPLWPGAITGPLAERAAFAAKVPTAEDLSVPAPAPEPGPGAERAAAGPERPRRRRRTRVVLAVVPVVVATGATLAVQLLPHVSGDPGARAGGTPSSSVPAPDGTAESPAGSTKARPTPEPDTSGPTSASSAPPSGDKAAKGETGERGQQGASGDDGEAAGAGTGSGSAGGTGEGRDGAGAAGGSGAPEGSGGASGTGTGGSGTGSGDGGTAASGTFALRNGENDKCLIQVYGAASVGSCGGAAASWTFRSAGDGTVKVVNRSTGACLSANMLGQAVATGDCNGVGSSRLWRSGAGGILTSVFNDGCLDLAFGGGVSSQSCASGAASQRWDRG
ncbi:protein kinase [Streptomyces flaveolus]|uniref:Protein kinase n=1 Tax=Streptomyces flaveolus TaxID=67297 RepID=A0ABV1VKE1_9ACTN